MYWPVFTAERFKNKVLKAKHTPWGASCTYIRWSKRVGLKVYTSKRERDRCVRAQGAAAIGKVGPQVGPKVSFSVFACMAHPRQNWGSDSVAFGMKRLYGYFTQHVSINRVLHYHDEARLHEELKARGIIHSDLAARNTGRVGKERLLVCVDFDSASCQLRLRKKRRK